MPPCLWPNTEPHTATRTLNGAPLCEHHYPMAAWRLSVGYISLTPEVNPACPALGETHPRYTPAGARLARICGR